MQAYREIIDGKRLGSIVNLPSELRDKEVKIIVLPVERNKKKKTKLSQNWAGALSDYRNQYTSLELQKIGGFGDLRLATLPFLKE